MSKKHYIQIAEMFKKVIEPLAAINADEVNHCAAERVQARASKDTAERLAFAFCNIAAGDNANFNRARFLAACGINS